MKIGFLSYAHLGINLGLPGGGGVTNELVKKVLEEAGHQVDFLQYKVPGMRIPGMPGLANKLNRLAILHAWRNATYINEVARGYDVLICESAVCHRIKHPRCINIFHFINSGYLDYGCVTPRNTCKYIKYVFAAIVETIEARGKFNVAVSEFSQKILERHGVPVYRVVPNAVDVEAFLPIPLREPMQRCLYVGSYSYYGKGFDLLEKIASLGVQIDCIADHPVGSSRGINYLGPVNHDLLPGVYAQYQILLFPSRFETFGLVPLEAMACGLPVVISNVGAAPAIKRYIPEFVVDGHEDDAAGEYVRRINLILGRYDEFSDKARQYAQKHHSMQKFRQDWVELIEALVHLV